MRQGMRLGQPFGNHLTGAEDVRPRFEDHDDRRQSGDGLRVDLVEECHALQEVRLERDRDQLLDLVRGEAQGLGVDLDVGRGEFREHIAGHARKLEEAEEQGDCRKAQHEAPIPKAPANDGPHHPADLPAQSGNRRGAGARNRTPGSTTSLSPIATRHSHATWPPKVHRRGKASPRRGVRMPRGFALSGGSVPPTVTATPDASADAPISCPQTPAEFVTRSLSEKVLVPILKNCH